MTVLKLSELLVKGDEAIAAASIFLSQRMATLDCTGVEAIAPAQLNLLLSKIPDTWDFVELGKVIDSPTLTFSFGTQLLNWIGDLAVSQSPPELGDFEVKDSKIISPPTPPSLGGTRISESSSPPDLGDLGGFSPSLSRKGEGLNTLNPIQALQDVIDEYKDYLLTEFRAKDPQLKADLETALERPLFLAQEPFYQAHRPFKLGRQWRDLPIDPKLARVIQKRSSNNQAYLHQSEAIAHLLGADASPLVVTTGTGSGKTETFLLPVIQNAIEDSIQFKKSGLTAILIYPMNALANDQLIRIKEYLTESGWAGTVTVDKYDRSTKQAERQQLRENPPHILLTNYMMLEYLLVRPADRENIFANHRCRFLVLDEVHTYRGTLGSNIALLIRRLQAHLANARQDWFVEPVETIRDRRYRQLIPVGTSATIKSVTSESISHDEQIRQRDLAVQDFFSKLTGAAPKTIHVIGEQLAEIQIPPEAKYSLHPDHNPLPNPIHRHKLLWDLNRWLIRAPMSISQIVDRVRSEVPERQQFDHNAIEREVKATLIAGAALPDDTDDAKGALRLRAHCLIRGGWQFHRCVSPTCGKLYPMGEEQCECGCKTAPLYLCRNCGAHYLRFVGENPVDPSEGILRPSSDRADEHEWMLYDPSRFEATNNIDEDDDESLDVDASGKNRKSTKQMRGRPIVTGSFEPRNLTFSATESDYPLRVTLAPARNRCLCCGGTAGSRSVITPVALGTSAAIKVLSEGLVETLAKAHKNQPNHDGKERLLVFSDSRQDAAHQARFIIFASRYDRLRRRLLKLLQQENSLPIQRAVELLGEIGVKENDNPRYQGKAGNSWLTDEVRKRVQAWEEAPLLDEISVNAGYRATLVNLGLVAIEYERLDEYVQQCGGAIAKQLGISLEQLEYICRCLLDEIRTRGCLSRDLLRYHPSHPSCPDYIRAADWERRMKQPSGYAASKDGQPLANLDQAAIAHGIRNNNAWRKPKVGGRSPSLERILKHLISRMGGVNDVNDINEEMMIDLLEFLIEPGKYLVASDLYGASDKAKLLQVNHEIVRLKMVQQDNRLKCGVCATPLSGAKIGFPCPQCHGELIRWHDIDIDNNRTVKRIKLDEVISLEAKEHTAQIPNDERIQIEEDFKASAVKSKINLLACSPTLEMGIDVGGLDAVILRNVPPRPDNYAQRGGRAGRRTRVGLVVGYARSTPHDQYFYDKPTEMISGEVPAPFLALGNRDVIFRHLNAIAFGLSETGLAGKMLDYVSANGEIKQEAVDALIAGINAQSDRAISLALDAWESHVLVEAHIGEIELRDSLAKLPAKIQDIIDRTARQVIELRKALESYYQQLIGKYPATRAADLVARILGIPNNRQNNQAESDDRSAGYPLRRFAEFGILPGYEFPTQPSSLRLLGDRYEDEPVTVARRLGINQFRPNANVYARTKRWKVIGLDNASPWNPKSDSPSWNYRICRICDLKFDADHPACPRCKSDEIGKSLPASEFAGFLAQPDESPILDEEERYAARNLVSIQPQWDGLVTGRWTVATGWSLVLRQDEEVRWLNEGLPPTSTEMQSGIPILHNKAKGYPICSSCGRMLKDPNIESQSSSKNNRGRRTTRNNSSQNVYGHSPDCHLASQPPIPLAIVTAEKAETLRLMLPVPHDTQDTQIMSWGLSLGYALKMGMQHYYMLDGSEIEFEFEGSWKIDHECRQYRLVSLTFIDPSLGGSGYLQRIATQFDLVAKRALEHLDHPNCETACYRCLKTYQNQRYHEHLNWLSVVPTLEEIVQNPPQPSTQKIGDLNDPTPWLEAYEAGVGSPLELKFLKLFEKYGFNPQKQVPIMPSDSNTPISVADFAIPEKRLAIYIDGASFHKGINLRRDRFIRDRLRNSNPPWQVIELRSSDLSRGESLVQSLSE